MTVTCRDCGGQFDPDELRHGLCEECDDHAYRRNAEKWRTP